MPYDPVGAQGMGNSVRRCSKGKTYGGALRVKLTEVLYVPRIRQWCPILHSHVNVSGVAELCHSEATLLAEGELVHSFTSKNMSEHQIMHIKLPTTHKLLVIAPDGTVHFGELLAIIAHRRGQYHHAGAGPARLRRMPGDGGRPW
jgi:hypothetical protein